MNKDKYRKAWLRAHKGYERRSNTLLKKYFKQAANKVPYEFLDEETYKQTIDNNVQIGGLYGVYLDIYKTIGIVHGNRIGKGINRDIKDFNPSIFSGALDRSLLQWIMENIGFRIVSVRGEFILYIQRLVAQGFKDGLTTRQLSDKIHRLINQRSFYRWQALRIARTESALAANRATVIAGETSGIVLDKMWISIPDNRTRPKPGTITKFNHRIMDGVKVDQKGFFNVQGEYLEYPSAAVTRSGAKSSGGNVINCRCTTALIPRRDSNGRIVRT